MRSQAKRVLPVTYVYLPGSSMASLTMFSQPNSIEYTGQCNLTRVKLYINEVYDWSHSHTTIKQ